MFPNTHREVVSVPFELGATYNVQMRGRAGQDGFGQVAASNNGVEGHFRGPVGNRSQGTKESYAKHGIYASSDPASNKGTAIQTDTYKFKTRSYQYFPSWFGGSSYLSSSIGGF